jgi:SAM-dependent methyltransferase
MSGILDLVLRCALLLVSLMPRRWRRRLFQLFVEAEERRGRPEEALRWLLRAEDDLARAVDRASVAYGGGVHPKHRLIGYHEFFVRNIRAGERVLDVGCGSGEVAADIAARVPGCHVTGVDLSAERIQRARERHQDSNLVFVQGDVLQTVPPGRFDVVVLSNVLEHVVPRVELLRRLSESGARRFLVRVPLFERHWSVPLRKELGLPYLSDPTHQIEYLQEEVRDELRRGGLRPVREELRWGEAWVVAVPQSLEAPERTDG